jgi:lipopolysaccharide biosynthesis glycosyltransferase
MRLRRALHRRNLNIAVQETLSIATAIDAAYLLPLKVMLASLKKHLRPSFRPVLYLLNQNLSNEQVASIAALIETHSIVPGSDALRALPQQRGFLPEAAFPLLLADLLPPSVERILFLDPDLLILDDVATIWEMDLRDNVLAAVADQAIPLCSSPRGVKNRSELGVPDDAPYFNAGVMLVDIARWKRSDALSRACEYIRTREGNVDFFHQEALNSVLWNDWLRLDQRWNCIASLTGRGDSVHGSRASTAPGIVHFAGRFKPWRFRVGGPFASRYADFASLYANGELPPTVSFWERLLSIYDRYLRNYLYGFERTLWNNRLI